MSAYVKFPAPVRNVEGGARGAGEGGESWGQLSHRPEEPSVCRPPHRDSIVTNTQPVLFHIYFPPISLKKTLIHHFIYKHYEGL